MELRKGVAETAEVVDLEALARHDPAAWRALVPALRAIANDLARSFSDISGVDDILGDLALAARERWVDEWLTRRREGRARSPLALFLRDRMRDRLREERRRRTRRAELLAGGGSHAIAPAAFPQADDLLAVEEVKHRATAGAPALRAILAYREEGLAQNEIASRTGTSPSGVSRQLAIVAALVASLVALGLAFLGRSSSPTAVSIDDVARREAPRPDDERPAEDPHLETAVGSDPTDAGVPVDGGTARSRTRSPRRAGPRARAPADAAVAGASADAAAPRKPSWRPPVDLTEARIEVARCWNAGPGETLEFHVVVEPSGTVSRVIFFGEVDAATRSCIESTARRWQYEPASETEVVPWTFATE
jgi:hypothetical protein